MLVNLNDSKISKIVYKLDEEHTIEFNYDNGELISVEGIVQKQDKTKDPFLKILETTRTEDFNDMLRETFGGEQKENEFKEILKKDLEGNNDEDEKTIDTPQEHEVVFDEQFFKKFPKIYRSQKLIEKIIDGTLTQNCFSDSCQEPKCYMQDENKSLEERFCERELDGLIGEIMMELNTTAPLSADFDDKVRKYRDGVKKLAALRKD